ncbi:tyrosine-type recombinase/integrase [Endozoicomonas atrinae]|uniref:tyrosine-type recombinase/integrase n=1 Tax=Endozoicomonas atrinae TaxID=1333660 RepID=UPI000826E2E4|nr:tyrosine-type recombinase/integrase [Endozoicomonas atrinae]
MKIINDEVLINQAANGPYKEISQKLANRGDGTLLIRIKPNKVELFFRYKEPGAKTYKYHKIGNHHLNSPVGLTFQKALSDAQRLADLRRDGHDISEILNKTKQELKPKPVASQPKTDTNIGTFQDLLNDYPEIHLAGRRSHKDVKNAFKNHIINVKRFGYLLEMPAAEIKPHHIVDIIARLIHEVGVKQQCNRVRSYLSAAFAWAMKHDHNPALVTSDRPYKYKIEVNPVQNIPTQEDFESKGKEQLTDRQIWLIWHHGLSTMGKSGHLAQLLLALGGVRQEHVLNTPWEKIKLKGKYPHLRMQSRKGRGSKPYDYIIPINDTALEIFKYLQKAYGHCNYPLPSTKGSGDVLDTPLGHDTFDKPIKRFQAYVRDELELEALPFTFGMIRGSISTRMHEAGVKKATKEKLQGHNQKDVTTEHYDVWEYKEEKLEASQKWEKYLLNLINTPYEKITDRKPEEYLEEG